MSNAQRLDNMRQIHFHGITGNGEWVGVKFAQLTEVSGIMTQGRQDYDQWVKRFKVGYTITEGGAVKFIKDEQGHDKVHRIAQELQGFYYV